MNCFPVMSFTANYIIARQYIYADVMELADMQDLGSCAERRMGSSPFIRTSYKDFLRPKWSQETFFGGAVLNFNTQTAPFRIDEKKKQVIIVTIRYSSSAF